jgi:hypothetical protein
MGQLILSLQLVLWGLQFQRARRVLMRRQALVRLRVQLRPQCLQALRGLAHP